MASRLFPRQADNTYHGQKLALWILGIVVLLNAVIGVNTTFNTRSVAIEADGFPLDSFPAAASQTVIGVFAQVGFSRIVICLVCLVIFLRYRALVPLAFAMLLVFQIGGQLVHFLHPLPRAGTPIGPAIVLGILAATAIGFALSLWDRRAERTV